MSIGVDASGSFESASLKEYPPLLRKAMGCALVEEARYAGMDGSVPHFWDAKIQSMIIPLDPCFEMGLDYGGGGFFDLCDSALHSNFGHAAALAWPHRRPSSHTTLFLYHDFRYGRLLLACLTTLRCSFGNLAVSVVVSNVHPMRRAIGYGCGRLCAWCFAAVSAVACSVIQTLFQ